jgi:hypothetical protein
MKRRHLLLIGSLGALPALPTLASNGSDRRLALLLGNRNYPPPFDLPPIPKNVRDLTGALTRRGFEVTDALDQDPPGSHRALDAFIRRVQDEPQDTLLFFYFSGHGVQVDASNLLISAGVNPAAQGEVLRKGSLLLLDDVVRRLPERKGGMTIAVVDACRTQLRSNETIGLNQVEAPPGCLIAFSTGAGKPAIAPAVETQNTFYTASLVKLLDTAPGETSFPELMSLVRADVRQTMQNHPVEAIRMLAQDPFIADHTRVRVSLSPESARRTAETPRRDENEDQDWAQLESLSWPAEVLRMAEAFLGNHPSSGHAGSVTVARDGAKAGVGALQRNDVRLYKSAFNLQPDMDAEQRQDLLRCGRGDKDAAARMAARFRPQAEQVPTARSRYEGWLQYAVALGNGIASYELALHYRAYAQPLLAAQFEARARELGYVPPPTLDNVRK